MKFIDSRSYIFSPHTHTLTLGANITSDLRYLRASVPQMHLSTKQKQTHRHREQTCGCQGGGGEAEEWTGSLGLVDANHYI